MNVPSLIVDNGGYAIKVGLCTDETPRIFPNCIFKSKLDRKRVYVADQISDLVERSSLFLTIPVERGYLVNWDVEYQIWERVFSQFGDPSEMRIAITDPIYTVPAIEDLSAEMLFEELGFKAVHKSSACGWIGENSKLCGNRCCLVVDCGYSFTHIVPMVDGKIIQRGVIRVDVGGKALTNLLKEWISYREYQVMEETYIINECKEDSCFTSLDFEKDMEITRKRGKENTVIREYVLPDFVENRRGKLREVSKETDDLQRVTMNIERFAIPEALFRPCEVGLSQMGIGEAVGECIRRVPINLRGALLQNIHVVGGCANFPNFNQRLCSEIRCHVDMCYEVCLAEVNDPIIHSWNAGCDLVRSNKLSKSFMTRAEYDEYGDDFSVEEKFFNFFNDPDYKEQLREERDRIDKEKVDTFAM